MDSIEKAIRSAFAKGDPTDRAFREKVYRSAFGALDRAIQTSPNMTEAIAARRRETLLAAITAIETEFVPARPAEAPPVQPAPQQPAAGTPAPEVAAPRSADFGPVDPGSVDFDVAAPDARGPAPEPDFLPTLDGERRPAGRPVEAGKGAGKGAGKRAGEAVEAPLREGRRRRPRRRFRFAGLLVGLLLLAGVAAVGWWLAGPGGAGLVPPRPPQSGGDAAPPIPGEADAFAGWIDIFTPADPTTVAAPGDSRAEVMEEDGEQFIRVSSGTSGSPVLFDIGQGILEQVAGRRAVFNIVARAQDGQETQISVDCSLGELGDCGRKRYAVGTTREEFLFEIDLPAAQPGSGGTIAVNPDIDGGGKAVDIYAIRVLPTQ